MAEGRSGEVYQGDAALAGLLKARKSYLDLPAVKAIIAGVAAAPAGDRAEDWMALVAPEPDDAMKAQLRALRAGFTPRGAPAPRGIAESLAALRAELKSQGLDGFIIGRGDEHQGEYVPQRADRLAWISGFNGSAGAAIVMSD